MYLRLGGVGRRADPKTTAITINTKKRTDETTKNTGEKPTIYGVDLR